MELLDTENLTPKEKREPSKVNAAIRDKLSAIPEGKSLVLREITAEISEEFGMAKSQVSVRVSTILGSTAFDYLQRRTDAQGRTCVGW